MKRFKFSGILVFVVVFVLMIALQEMGIISSLSISSSISWIFVSFNVIVPAGAMILAWWVSGIDIAIGATIIFIAYIFFVFTKLGMLSGSWGLTIAFPIIIAIGCGCLVYSARRIRMNDYGLFLYLGYAPVIMMALITPGIINVSGYLSVVLLPGLITIPTAIMLSYRKGGLLAISAMMIGLSVPIQWSTHWFSWSSMYIEVGGFVVFGLYLASQYWVSREASSLGNE
jgi:hypothetical protein